MKRILTAMLGAVGATAVGFSIWWLAIARSGTQIATVLTLVVSTLILVATVVAFRRQSEEEEPARIARAAERVARTVRTRELIQQQKLLAESGEPQPADIDFRPPQEIYWRSDGDLCEGSFREIKKFYLEHLRHGRLVILGDAGSGKTVLANQFLLDLLKAILEGGDLALAPTGPGRIPIRLSASSFDFRAADENLTPEAAQELIDSWITSYLTDIADFLKPKLARALIRDGMILPIVDGLDEMDDPLIWPRRAAGLIRILNQPAHGTLRPVVVTCRTEVYQRLGRRRAAAGQEPVLQEATAVEIQPLTPCQVAAYVTGRFPGPADQRRWRPVLTSISRRPGGALARALSSPLGLFLAVTGYYDSTDDPKEMLGPFPPAEDRPADIPAQPVRKRHEEEINRRLYGKLIKAVTAQHGTSKSGKRVYDACAVELWLGRLADYLDRRGTEFPGNGSMSRTDIALYELWPVAGRRIRLLHALTGALVVALAVLIIARVFIGTPNSWLRYTASAVAAAGSTPPGLLLAQILSYTVAAAVPLIALHRCIQRWPRPLLRQRRQVGIRQLVALGAVAALITAVVAITTSATLVLSHSGLGLLRVVLVAVAPGLALIVGLKSGLGVTKGDSKTTDASPRSMLRSDAIVGVGAGLVLGLGAGIAAWTGGIAGAAPVPGLQIGTTVAVPVAFAAGFLLGFALAASSWTRYLLAVIAVARRGELPLRLGRFLDWAYDAGLLRIAGTAFQFRHHLLQQTLEENFRARDRQNGGPLRRRTSWLAVLLPAVALLCLTTGFTVLTGPRCSLSTVCNATGQSAAMMAWPTTNQSASSHGIPNSTVGSFPPRHGALH